MSVDARDFEVPGWFRCVNECILYQSTTLIFLLTFYKRLLPSSEWSWTTAVAETSVNNVRAVFWSFTSLFVFQPMSLFKVYTSFCVFMCANESSVTVAVDSVWWAAIFTSRTCHHGSTHGSWTAQHQCWRSPRRVLQEHKAHVQHLSLRTLQRFFWDPVYFSCFYTGWAKKLDHFWELITLRHVPFYHYRAKVINYQKWSSFFGTFRLVTGFVFAMLHVSELYFLTFDM